MTESSTENQLLVLRLGELQKPLAPGHSYTVGRDAECDLALGHGSIGQAHCRLTVTADSVLVTDLESLVGTGVKIDGVRVKEGIWTPGQTLEIGEIKAELTVAAAVMTMEEVAAAAAKLGAMQTAKEQEFGEIMFHELKRAPWFMLSGVVHAIVLVLLWLLLDHEIPKGSDGRRFAMEAVEAEDEVDEDMAEVEAIEQAAQLEDAEFAETEVMEEAEAEVLEEETAVYDSAPTDYGDLLTNLGSKGDGSGLSDILKEARGSVSGNFKKTVGQLRKNGLEIVFVFDSTGSMGSVLTSAKERIGRMVGVLHELVPYAKIGMVTYRDHDDSEAYTTRQVALSRDFYRAINFLSVVDAGGGGDIPEAIYEALQDATRQKWNDSARRLIVLIGDAPPHRRTEGKISSMVKSFARRGKSFVHAIATRPDSEREISKETRKTFRRIARDGQGESLTFENEEGILRAVMSLAFGRSNSKSLTEVYRIAEARSKKYSRTAKKIVAERDLAALRRAFRKKPVDHDIVKAILNEPNRDVLKELVALVRRSSTPNPGRHAASFLLQKLLFLDEPPVDPETCKNISRRRADRYIRYIDRNYK